MLPVVLLSVLLAIFPRMLHSALLVVFLVTFLGPLVNEPVSHLLGILLVHLLSNRGGDVLGTRVIELLGSFGGNVIGVLREHLLGTPLATFSNDLLPHAEPDLFRPFVKNSIS